MSYSKPILVFVHSGNWSEASRRKFCIDEIRQDGIPVRTEQISDKSFFNVFIDSLKILYGSPCQSSALYVPLFRLNLRTYPFFLLLSIVNAKFYFLLNASQPVSGQQLSKARYGRKRATYELWAKIKHAIPLWIFGLRAAKGIVIDGSAIEASARRLCPPSNDKTSLIYSHSLDYYRLTMFTTSFSQIELPARYAVFIDQALDCHPDFQLNNEQPPATDQYFMSMNKFFANTTEQIGLPVIVSRHPKRYGETKFKCFGEFVGMTTELVERCDLIIAHYSTAIGIGVFYNKPIIIVTTEELQSNEKICIAISLYAEALKTHPVRAEGSSLNLYESMREKNNYDSFKSNHLVHPCAKDQPWFQSIIRHYQNNR